MGWFGKERDWNDARRLVTALGALQSVGAGHDPVSLDTNADVVLEIPGVDDDPQQIGLDTQAANTVFAGPTTGADDYPTFRAMVVADIAAHDLLSATHGDTAANDATRGSLIYANDSDEWDELTHPGIGYALTTDANDVAWDQTPIWPGKHTFTAATAIEIDVASGDPIIVFDTDGADRFTVGVDDTDSDKFKINSGASLADPSDFELDSSGNVEIGGDFNLLTGKGIIHADGVTAGYVLRADGTRYVPASAAGTIPFAPTAQGDLIVADATPAWSRLALSAPAAGTCNYLGVDNGESAPSYKGGSSNPGAAAAILASAADGGLQLLRLGIGADPDTNNRITMVDGGQIGDTGEPLIEFDNTNDYLEITGCDVGIGTTAPAGTLHVHEDNGDAEIYLSQYKGDTTAADIFLRKARGTTSPADVNAGDMLGALYFSGYRNSDWRQAAMMTVEAEALGASAVRGEFVWYTTNVADTWGERMRLDMGGYLGIGITNPTERLEIDGNAYLNDGYLLSEQATGGNTSHVIMRHAGAPAANNVQWAWSVRSNNEDVLLYGYDGTNYTNLLFCDADGRVGINDTSPDGTLDVVQSDASGAIPTLQLEQADESEGLVNFVGSDRGAITGATNSAASVRAELNGTVYRIALYADA